MATNFPTSLDALTNPTSSDSLSSPSHSAQHANVNDAVEALQAKVGVDGSAVTSSLDYKVGEHGWWLRQNTADLVTLTSSYQALTFENEVIDTDEYHSTVSNTDEVTIPSGLDGWYAVTMTVNIAASTYPTSIDLLCSPNGTPNVYNYLYGLTPARPAFAHASTLSGITKLAAGDVLRMYVAQIGGSSVSTLGTGTAAYMTNFRGKWIGK